MRFRKFLIIGGDKRNVALARQLAASGNKVRIFGFEKLAGELKGGLNECVNLDEADGAVEIVVGPMPCCADGTLLNAPFHEADITVDTLIGLMNGDQFFIAGMIDRHTLELTGLKCIKTFDLLEREDMAILNAIPAAEGAIQLAMEEMDVTLHGNNAMVLGYGRVGKILCKMLQGIGACVYTAVRSHKDAAAARSLGHRALFYEELPEFLGKMHVIFNTVPSTVLDTSNIKYVREKCILIDLASKPFGIESEAGRQEGLKVLLAQSLPGKVAPVTAASYIYETIHNIINENW